MKRLCVLLLTVLAAGCLLILSPWTASAADIIAQSPAATAAPAADAPAADTPSVSADATAAEATAGDAEPSIYNAKVPLDEDLQQYLYDLCAERGLDYKMALAIIRHESSFNAKALGGGSNYGLFQINKCNHKSLSKALKTANTPFDPETNINWGTHILSCLFTKYADTYSGEDLLKAVLSAYNRGDGGFHKYGFARSYIKGYYKNLQVVSSWFE